MAERAAREISAMNGVMAQHVLEQASVVDAVFEDAVVSTEAVKAGNAQLEAIERAGRGKRSWRTWVVVFFVVAGCIILFLDWILP